MAVEKSKNKKRRRASPLILIVLILLTLMIGVQSIHVFRDLSIAKAEANALSQQVQDRTEQNNELKEDLDKKDDIGFIKSLARKLLGLVEGNEKLFFDVND